MHMLRKKDLSSDEMETLRRSRNTTVVVTANGEVQTNEEAQVYRVLRPIGCCRFELVSWVWSPFLHKW